ncbi:MAG: hypothetical protein JXD21_03485 [Candidatus Omnitrophica bacterium]|nr:hypothetical protein [Candidatus Omnitrophota bacterium]
MNKRLNILMVGLMTISLMPGCAHTHRYHPVDLNRDGKITRTEKVQYNLFQTERDRVSNKWIDKRREWRTYQYMVSNFAEQQYDRDKDGWLMPAETKRLLYDKYKEIKKSGSAPAVTHFEQMYDINHDGRLDEDEAIAIRQDF